MPDTSSGVCGSEGVRPAPLPNMHDKQSTRPSEERRWGMLRIASVVLFPTRHMPDATSCASRLQRRPMFVRSLPTCFPTFPPKFNTASGALKGDRSLVGPGHEDAVVVRSQRLFGAWPLEGAAIQHPGVDVHRGPSRRQAWARQFAPWRRQARALPPSVRPLGVSSVSWARARRCTLIASSDNSAWARYPYIVRLVLLRAARSIFRGAHTFAQTAEGALV